MKVFYKHAARCFLFRQSRSDVAHEWQTVEDCSPIALSRSSFSYIHEIIYSRIVRCSSDNWLYCRVRKTPGSFRFPARYFSLSRFHARFQIGESARTETRSVQLRCNYRDWSVNKRNARAAPLVKFSWCRNVGCNYGDEDVCDYARRAGSNR